MANTEKVRLNKYLSETGICSRRDADKLIEEGKVVVNGKIAEPGMRVNDLDRIEVEGKPCARREKKVVLAYYKPVGVTCTEKDKHAQVTIKDVLDYPVRVTYAGRLDRDSEGLLLMTNDGDLINGLMRAANYHEKEYLVRVNKPMSREFLKKMSEGVMLKELKVKTRPCFVKEESKFVFRIILTQGLNRQIRRMCKECGYTVVNIRRVRVANIMLGDLEPGKIRPVVGSELKELYYNVQQSAAKGESGKNREELIAKAHGKDFSSQKRRTATAANDSRGKKHIGNSETSYRSGGRPGALGNAGRSGSRPKTVPGNKRQD
ncbi:MAG: pseudouridine synthase [Lachnospiraceae bacterium]|nr:pseudouridine synthase [Lachnospiraceae bacterium]